MKRVLLGSLIAAIISFVFQAMMWMGEFYPNYTNYTGNQDSIVQYLDQNLNEDGLYVVPSYLPNSSEAEKEAFAKKTANKPWAMIFYHNKMDDNMGLAMSMGMLNNFLSAFFISLVLYFGNFAGFGRKFLVAISYFFVVIFIGIFDEINWWSFPMQFIWPQITDVLGGWGLSSLWLAFFIKNKQ